ncbi:NAD(P)H-hydrate dehydratase [Planctomicrobium sp. SH661]|uniref:NAD(P)H-hydrate dehydratase n=1 Tax=Planctomicrobium sp. SH661 TaxID=3448124 RepID=UPI003F5C5BE8
MIQRVTTLPHIPTRPGDSHKGTFGRVLIVAGSPGMSGAAALSGLGALRGGAGLVYVAVPSSILPIVAAIEPSYLTVPLDVDRNGELGPASLGEVWAAIDGKSACAIGPGLGTHKHARAVVQSVYADAEIPLVVDADALNCLSENTEAIRKHAGPRILTPHPGEFARLIDSDIATVQPRREELAVKFAAENDVVLVLKGQGTIVTDGTQVYTNTTGNSGMSTGGTGDVLTGLTTALLAQKMAPFQAAQFAVFLHGRAGDLAAAELSQPGLIASDLAKYLGRAWLSVQS